VSVKPEPRNQEKFVNPGQITPADRLIADMDGVYYKLTEVADMLNVSPTTMRRLLYNRNLKAPSFTAKQGRMRMYLYTPEDLQELREFFEKRRRGEEREARNHPQRPEPRG
jgi:hypothetical protein